MVASEVSPFAKTGGLADVLSGLPHALDRLGHNVTIVMPKYRGVAAAEAQVSSRPVRFGARTRDVGFHTLTLSPRRRVVLVDMPALFDREGGLYGVGGRDYPDSAERFGWLAAAALEFVERDPDNQPCDVLHAHDWQAGLLHALIKITPAQFPRAAAAGLVFTIHNLAYQGLFPRDTLPSLGLPWSLFRVEVGEFWGQFSFLKTGITQSDWVTTVSPSYAKETLTAEFGGGLEGVLASRGPRYVGILNGIDADVWDPSTDPLIPARFDAADLAGKRESKRGLLEQFGLSFGDDALERPVIGMVSRLVEQKGVDLVAALGDDLLSLDAAWIFLGQGDARYERALTDLAARHPARVAVRIGFDEKMAHLIEAGSDVFLMPSKFEPCGLNQMYSLRYGTVPVVRAVGGLDDTIQPFTARARNANGFKFQDATPEALMRTLRQAVRMFSDREAWRGLMLNGMAADHSWETSAREYVKVYRRARQDAAARAGH